MLKLPDVTIWTMVWADDRKWIVKAGQVLRYCATIIEPAELVLFTSEKLALSNYPWRTVQIPKLTWANYNLFVNRVIPTFIHSKFSMSVHEDGFPIDVSQWTNEFLDYDYIGAPWSDRRVGNGGFNVESRKLMDLKCKLPVLMDEFTTASDRFVCDNRRSLLESQGAKFAPFDLALKFSTEQVGNEFPSFGFHGRHIAADKYRRGWRQVTQAVTQTRREGFTKIGNMVVSPSMVP